MGSVDADAWDAEEWPVELGNLLKKTGRPYLDAVIDSGGGDILGQTSKLLKAGGKLVCYGM
jgi:NADPH:quinone reductase-like Zn-dependent oxidoreductase